MSLDLLFVVACVQTASLAGPIPQAPRSFSLIENCGQWNTQARFVGELGDALVRIESQAIWLDMPDKPGSTNRLLLKLSFEGASASAIVEGLRPTPTVNSYFLGNDPTKWVHAAPSYEQVRLVGVYPGIDVVIGARAGRLKYDVHAAARTDLSQFVVRCEGAAALCIDQDLGLRIETIGEPLVQALGDAWEERADGSKRSVYPRWRMLDPQRFTIELADRDPAARLVIDPEVYWATYLGTSSNSLIDLATAVAAADDGTVIVVGAAGGLSFPTTPGSVLIGPPNDHNMFVTRLSADGSSLVYSCIIGGSMGSNSGGEVARAVDVDSANRAYVVGWTTAQDFPTTSGAFDRILHLGSDAFALKISPQGDALEYSTFAGGTDGDEAYACAAAASGALVFVGETSTDFPTTANAFQPTTHGNAEVFVTRLSPDGSTLEWSTYLGGTSADRGLAVALAENEDVVLAGRTNSQNFPTTPGTIEPVWLGSTSDCKAFITRLDASGSALVWSTLLGGPGVNGPDGTTPYAVAVIPSGDVFVAGGAFEFLFPTTAGAFQPQFHYNASVGFAAEGFLSRLNANASALVYSTFLGTDYSEYVVGLAVDASGIATVASYCVQIPTTPGSFQPIPHPSFNFGVSRFDPSGSRLIYSTVIGGPLDEAAARLAMSPEGRVTVVGYSEGGFPVTPGSFDTTYNGGQFDAAVATLDLFPTGVNRIGVSTPSCHGPLILQTREMPQTGSATFSLLCSNVPPNAPGWLLLAGKTLTQPVYHGATALWIAPPMRFARIPVMSDADGFVEVPISIGNAPSGARLAAQMMFRNTLQCPGQGLTCASPAIEVVVQ